MFVYCPASKGFYPLAFKEEYEAAGTWPSSGIEVSEEAYHSLIQGTSQGKDITLDESGVLRLIDPPGPTEDEMAEQVRSRRDKLLDESDWTQMPDAPVDKEVWSAYRQALRDIPQQSGFPFDVEWPEVPA